MKTAPTIQWVREPRFELINDKLLDSGRSRKFARKWMTRQLKLLPKVKLWRKWAIIAGVTLFDITKSLRA